MSGLEEIDVLMASYENNTSQGKGWIFDLGSTVRVCSQKEILNSLVAKEKGTVKMVDGSTCEVTGTGTVKATERAEKAGGMDNEQCLVTKALGRTIGMTQLKMRVENLAASRLGEFSEQSVKC